MRSCDEYCVQLSLYLDGELDNNEKRAFEAHLKDCQGCRKRCNRERRFLNSLKGGAPLYVAFNELRTQVRSIIHDAPSVSNVGPARKSHPVLLSWFSGVQLFAKRPRFATVLTGLLTGLLVLAGLWTVARIINPAQSLTFAAVAVDAHQRHTLGRLPLELTSESPDKISRWFDGKVPFSLKLPNYQEISGQDKLYSLTGARLIGFKNDYAAYVAYKMGQYPISLIVTSSANVKPEGGERIVSKGLVFHYETLAGLKVITWTHRGLTYALVSDLDERGQQSCLVCHHGTKDQELISNLDSIDRSARVR